MALGRIQVTIGAAATQVTSTRTPVSLAIVEADDGNTNPAFVGDADVTTANGIRLNNSATSPENVSIGPFVINAFDLADLYIAGTQNELVNILYVQL